MNKLFRRLPLLGLVCLATACATWAYAPSRSAISAVQGCPQGPVEKSLQEAVQSFNNAFASQLEIQSIQCDGQVSSVTAAVARMMNTLAIIDEPQKGTLRIATAPDVAANVPADQVSQFRKALETNVNSGDLLVNVSIKEQQSGRVVSSVNSLSPTLDRAGGTLFQTTVLAGGVTTVRSLPNTVDGTKTVVNYIWPLSSYPKGEIYMKVEGKCQGGQCTGCLITDIMPQLHGPGLSIKTMPDTGPAKGLIDQPCCYGTVNYWFVTGFKELEAEVDAKGVKVGFKAKGVIGREGNGFFTLKECCKGEAGGAVPTAVSIPSPEATPVVPEPSEPTPIEETPTEIEEEPDDVAILSLSFPGDCKRKKLVRAANKDGCSTEAGGNHTTVKKNGQVITQIPNTVYENGTCREIIKVLNEQCL